MTESIMRIKNALCNNKRFIDKFIAFVVISVTLFASCGTETPPEPVRRSVESLGTIVTITIYDDPKPGYFDGAFALVDQVYRLMSLQLEDSELVALNAAAGVAPVEVSPMTMEVLQAARGIAEQSNGRFTPMIEPLVALWDIGGVNPRIPGEDELAEAVELMDLDILELYPSENPRREPHRAYLNTEGAGVDLGGIAKGYAADLVSDYLKEQGVTQAILDFGGNILTIGRKNEERPWIIGLQRPDMRRGIYLGTVPAEDISVVTSGVYERFFEENGVRYHHLLNPDTGFPVENRLEGVAILSDVSMTADGYSTALFGLGLEDGLAAANRSDEIEAIFITADKKVYLSDGIAGEFQLLDEEYEIAVLEAPGE
jgi:thiamine biosynthesis lipoprotein